MNYIFSDFLSKLSPEFRAKVGKDVSPKWPVGAAFSRCQDLLASAAKMSGAIGYAELRCGEGSGLPIARIRNAAGEFVKPSTKSRSEEHTSELQSRLHLVCRLLLEKKKPTQLQALY